MKKERKIRSKGCHYQSMKIKKKKKKKIRSRRRRLLLPFLPEEIITDVLTRVQVKTLLRFRCVCKSWLKLISNPDFTNAHLVKSSESNNFSQERLVLWCRSTVRDPLIDSYYLTSRSLHSGYCTFSDSHSVELDIKLNKIVGSCNGLVCIAMNKEKAFFIWNPSTGESKRLSVLDNISLSYDVVNCFGFGYDQRSGDYNVVHMKFNNRYGHPPTNKVRVYSLGTNSCRNIGDFPYGTPKPHLGKFLNGALHWAASIAIGFVSSSLIVSLDLGNKTYGEIEQPDYGVDYSTQSLVDVDYSTQSLVILEGCISVLCDIVKIRTDIWVMKEYGVRDSWVKLYTIPRTYFPMKMDYLLSNSLSGQILMKLRDMLVICYTKYGSFRTQRIGDMSSYAQGATTYVESLVSSLGWSAKY